MRTKQKRINQLGHGLALFFFVGLAWMGTSIAAQEPLRLELARPAIKISTFYNGTTLKVTGIAPANADILLQLSGPKNNVHLKVKGKVAGFLWMNKTDAELDNTPAVYMVYTPEKMGADLLRPELGVGYKALIKDITIKPASADKAFIFDEYVKLMEQSGVYAVGKATVVYGATDNDGKEFSATLTIPSKMNAGSYTIEAVAVRAGKVVGRTRKTLTLELSGLPKVIATLAFGRPLLFGIMSVFIALATGLIIGVLFKGGGGAH